MKILKDKNFLKLTKKDYMTALESWFVYDIYYVDNSNKIKHAYGTTQPKLIPTTLHAKSIGKAYNKIHPTNITAYDLLKKTWFVFSVERVLVFKKIDLKDIKK